MSSDSYGYPIQYTQQAPPDATTAPYLQRRPWVRGEYAGYYGSDRRLLNASAVQNPRNRTYVNQTLSRAGLAPLTSCDVAFVLFGSLGADNHLARIFIHAPVSSQVSVLTHYQRSKMTRASHIQLMAGNATVRPGYNNRRQDCMYVVVIRGACGTYARVASDLVYQEDEVRARYRNYHQYDASDLYAVPYGGSVFDDDYAANTLTNMPGSRLGSNVPAISVMW